MSRDSREQAMIENYLENYGQIELGNDDLEIFMMKHPEYYAQYKQAYSTKFLPEAIDDLDKVELMEFYEWFGSEYVRVSKWTDWLIERLPDVEFDTTEEADGLR